MSHARKELEVVELESKLFQLTQQIASQQRELQNLDSSVQTQAHQQIAFSRTLSQLSLQLLAKQEELAVQEGVLTHVGYQITQRQEVLAELEEEVERKRVELAEQSTLLHSAYSAVEERLEADREGSEREIDGEGEHRASQIKLEIDELEGEI